MKRILVIISIFCLSVGTVVAPPRAMALFSGGSGEACKGVNLNNTGTCNANSGGQINNAIKLAISIFSLVVGVAAVIMILVGGFKYITSSGEASNISSAKNTILYAIIGLIVVVLAQVIVRFVIKNSSTPPKCSPSITTNCTP